MKARFSTSGRRQNRAEQSMGVKSHLCGLTTIESARSHPASTSRRSGRMAATPPYAASTWSQRPSRAAMSAIAGTGSTLVVPVVPTVAHTAMGRQPAARSSPIARASAAGSIRNSRSVGIFRTPSRPKPRMIAPFSTELCACSDV